MRSIQRRYKSEKEKQQNQNLSDFILFCKAIKNQEFKKQYICRWFNKLVSRDDYEEADKKDLINFMCLLTDDLEDNQKRG